MTDLTNPNTERFRKTPSDETVEGCLGASSAGQGEVTPSALATTPPLDLAALTVIANAATEGPWTAKPYSYGVQDGRIRVTSPSDSGIYNLAEDVTETDAAHVAAFDPPTVLALIARVEEQGSALDDEVRHAASTLERHESVVRALRAEAVAALARAEAAETKIAAVREALEGHPSTCDRHTEDDPITCGWKRAVADITHALGVQGV